MVKFYKLARYEQSGVVKPGFLREEGIFLPNNYGLELVVYRAEAVKGGDKVWYVVECSSGSGLGEGKTKNAAIQAFENNVQRLGIKGIEKAVHRSIELYGLTPDHRETEAF